MKHKSKRDLSSRSFTALLAFMLVIMISLTAFTVPDQNKQDFHSTAVASGRSTLSWNQYTKQLIVTTSVLRLSPNSIYSESIRSSSTGSVIYYILNDLVTSAWPNARTQTVISGVNSSIPSSGWYIVVTSGSTIVLSGNVVLGNVGTNRISIATATLS